MKKYSLIFHTKQKKTKYFEEWRNLEPILQVDYGCETLGQGERTAESRPSETDQVGAYFNGDSAQQASGQDATSPNRPSRIGPKALVVKPGSAVVREAPSSNRPSNVGPAT